MLVHLESVGALNVRFDRPRYLLFVLPVRQASRPDVRATYVDEIILTVVS